MEQRWANDFEVFKSEVCRANCDCPSSFERLLHILQSPPAFGRSLGDRNLLSLITLSSMAQSQMELVRCNGQ